jgi:hypothetical protein
MKVKRFQPEIRSYFYQLPEEDKIHTNLEAVKNWEPNDPTTVELHIGICIGTKGKKGDTEFTAYIVTSNLVAELKDKSRLIIIPYYDGWSAVETQIHDILFTGIDENYDSFCHRVLTHLRWEFEYLKSK